MELVTFGIPDGFPPQPADITRKLVGLVDSYNTMMPLRQKYLYKKIRGERGKEMADLEKTLTRCVNRIDEKIEGIREAGGFCPNRPKLFDSVPKPLKQQKEKVKSGVK
ncbi:uncharacterized protein LOC123406012 [Hordeum vulgare subsp. vulgare]|uniref:Predicted protein n=1 Tax=Hordeum vulgare subsp. vulgare TaxID=112509 RepID=F2D9H9_HORVV|nr:uncharacterized protein LOC123406012 [Hordeum vulgare subsp. vulgare]BAJ91750.1 predicted protein [Hordeum vulgare subsp. vulgare]